MKDFLIKNSLTIIGFSLIFGLIIHGYTGYLDRKKYFDEGETLYTVGEVVNYNYENKSTNVYFTFMYKGVDYSDISYASDAAKNSVYRKHISNVDKMKNLVIGKKFFVKFLNFLLNLYFFHSCISYIDNMNYKSLIYFFQFYTYYIILFLFPSRLINNNAQRYFITALTSLFHINGLFREFLIVRAKL